MASSVKVSKAGDTWNGVAYTYFRDSREFRTLLSLNESFDIRSFPAQGVSMLIGPVRGITLNGGTSGAAVGSLIQPDVNIDLRASSSSANPSVSEAIFPWESVEAYGNRLVKYTAAAMLQRDRINGYTLDSAEALTGM